MSSGRHRLRNPCTTKSGRDFPTGYLLFGLGREFREMLVMGAVGNEGQHRKSEIFSGRGKRGRITDKGRARRHPGGTARTPVQFAELPLSDRRSGQDANRAFIRDEIDTVI